MPGPWQHVGTVVAGSVLVQVVAQLVGTGLGMLVRSPVVAFVLSIVLPLGLWLGLGAAGPLRPAQGWLTPYASAQNLLSGGMTPVNWAQWMVLVLLWGVGLNAVGAVVLRRHVGPGRASPDVSEVA